MNCAVFFSDSTVECSVCVCVQMYNQTVNTEHWKYSPIFKHTCSITNKPHTPVSLFLHTNNIWLDHELRLVNAIRQKPVVCSSGRAHAFRSTTFLRGACILHGFMYVWWVCTGTAHKENPNAAVL